MDEKDFLARQFESDRAHLERVAYRMLGSLPEAQDAVQESWLRLARADTGAVGNLTGWLTTVVARICLDGLRSRRARREEALEPHSLRLAAAANDGESEMALADSVGLALLVVFVTSFQVMIDKGRELDWFESSFIIGSAVVALVSLVVLVIWELTDDAPALDLSVFKSRNWLASTASLSLMFGIFFGNIVLTPLWLQQQMGYTATWAGYATAFNGVAAVMMAPVVAKRMTTVDPRRLVFIGVLWLGGTSLLRVFWWSSGSDFWTLALPQLIQGAGMPFFFVPLTTIALGAVTVVLLLGLTNFARGGSPHRSQKLMRLRVLLQFIALIVIMLTIWAIGR